MVAVSLAACSATPPSHGSGRVRVVAVETVYGNIASQIGGDAVDATSLLHSPSADPHAYEPTARDADAVAAADVVIENGLGYDAFVDKLLAASPRNGRTTLNAGALGGHRLGDNPHVWYDTVTLRNVCRAIAAELARRDGTRAVAVVRQRDRLLRWIDRTARRMRLAAARYGGTPIAITEPVFDYALDAMRLRIATPRSFSRAIEAGNDPSPQDVDAMHALLQRDRVAAFVYNRQTVEPATAQLLDASRAAAVPVVAVTETLPPGTGVQAWFDGELDATLAALRAYRH